MPTLTDLAPADPHPPVPGPAVRAAVAVRARHLSRRRRLLQGAGGLAVVAVAVAGVVAVEGGSGTDSPRVPVAATTTASVHGHLAVPAGSTAAIRLTGPGGTYEIAVDAGGDFSLSGIEPGTYTVLATVETPGVEPGGDISVGSALAVGRTEVTLTPGEDQLLTIPATP
jgi:hypothetical protein